MIFRFTKPLTVYGIIQTIQEAELSAKKNKSLLKIHIDKKSEAMLEKIYMNAWNDKVKTLVKKLGVRRYFIENSNGAFYSYKIVWDSDGFYVKEYRPEENKK